MNPKISVIIPVYNAEEFLKFCIESLLNQSLKEIEFIFINDGSQDGSLKILNEYAAIDERVIVVDQLNQGVSVARNNGMKLAKAEFISFVDADDTVSNEIFEKMITIATKYCCDLVMFDVKTTLDGNISLISYPFPARTVLDAQFIETAVYERLISQDDMFAVWNKLYRKQIIEDFDIKFPKGRSLSEDNLFNLAYFGRIKNMYYLDEVGYYYREVPGSATRNILSKNYLKNYLDIYHLNYRKFLNTTFTDNELEELKAKKLVQNIKSMVFFYFTTPAPITIKERFELVDCMLSNRELQAVMRRFPQFLQSTGKFDKLLNWGLKKKNMNLLYALAKYSEIRSR